MRIAIDIMGSDLGPAVISRGAFQSLAQLSDVNLLLVGDPKVIEGVAKETGASANRYQILEASDVIGMDEHPVEALRKKPNASLIKAIAACAEGKADAIISAGSTGAQVAASIFVLRNLPGIRRAGIAAVLPAKQGRIVVIDVGANVNCKPGHLYQYGVMASIYAEVVLGLANPRVGLLSVGSEKTKGTTLVKETNSFFENSSLNFVGNCEGHEIFRGKTDVVVCEGFVGNVLLKIAEGMAETMIEIFHAGAKAGGIAETPGYGQAMRSIRARVDWKEVGGAQLLGVNGVSVIAHGRSEEAATIGAIKTASKLVAARLNERILEALGKETAGVVEE